MKGYYTTKLICRDRIHRKCVVRSSLYDAGRYLTNLQRKILERDWNQCINRRVPISMRKFARLHNVPYET